MKKIFIYLAIFVTSFCFSQKEENVSVLYGIETILTNEQKSKMKSLSSPDLKKYVDFENDFKEIEFLLEIKNSTSEFETKKKLKVSGKQNILQDSYADKRYYVDAEIYISQFDFLEETYLIEEIRGYQKWDLKNETKNILGYTCYKAILKDAPEDAKITAWYAPELPYQFGPTGYHGLPGLILETIQNEKLVVFAKEINLKADDIWVLKPTTGIKTTKEKFDGILGTAKDKMESYNKN